MLNQPVNEPGEERCRRKLFLVLFGRLKGRLKTLPPLFQYFKGEHREDGSEDALLGGLWSHSFRVLGADRDARAQQRRSERYRALAALKTQLFSFSFLPALIMVWWYRVPPAPSPC